MNKKEIVLAAIEEALKERTAVINTASVLVPFISNLTRISISGFYTEQGFIELIKMINNEYLDLANPDVTNYIKTASDEIYDFVALVYHNLLLLGGESLDLNSLCKNQTKLMDILDMDSNFKAMFSYKDRGDFVNVCFLLRLNVSHILRLIEYGEGTAI